eukprot:CAMPEP_0178511890 /NCGR_PEP_ID=MMETSP0696-20121128/22602_1 /TAXON_ID=265572 /ORGANISM="Extubocellulus spinifer, Strain CCMP396" /LENGTH=213 /DNA_ID=CAMNT_0020141691 /DNA_START=7 /DNA_END=648 /DNA_ORIENTATION=+
MKVVVALLSLVAAARAAESSVRTPDRRIQEVFNMMDEATKEEEGRSLGSSYRRCHPLFTHLVEDPSISTFIPDRDPEYAGDREVWGQNTLKDHYGVTVGLSYGVCTLTTGMCKNPDECTRGRRLWHEFKPVTGFEGDIFHCQITFDFGYFGSVTMQGLSPNTFLELESNPSDAVGYLAITGGTRCYEGVTGTVSILGSENQNTKDIKYFYKRL